MQHPINPLTDDGLAFLNDRLTDIRVAIEDLRLEPQRGEAPVMERCERILPTELFNELQAYLGSIEQHHATICDLLYGEGTDLRVDGLVSFTDEETDPVRAIEVTDAVAAARQSHDEQVSKLARLGRQLDAGLITLREFQACLDSEGIDQTHPCAEPGCANIVPFDDEPRCFTHSPDEGSSVEGYSFLRSVLS